MTDNVHPRSDSRLDGHFFLSPRHPALAVAPPQATFTHRHHHTHARPNPHRHLVSFETSPRIIRHELTYQMIRASNNDCECRDDSLQTRSDTHSAARNRQEQHDMRHVRNPVSEKRCDAPKRCPPADSDINNRCHRTHQGETDSHHHGFLCLCQPIIEISINGFTPQLALHKQQQH